MSVLIIRAEVKEEHAADAEAGVKEMFAAVSQAQPEGVRYASCKLPDGVTFVALLELAEGVENPLPTVPEWKEFTENLEGWRAAPPTVEEAQVVGSYRLFG